MIVFSIIIYILLKQKDKPKLLYILMIINYLVFIIFAIVSRMTINTITIENIAPKSARIIRDINLILFLIQIVFTSFLLIRTFGFDIKKFHFGEDLQFLEIDVTDDEEVELTTGVDTDKMIRKLEMKKEDLKAFYLENKIIILLIAVLLVIVIPATLIIRNNTINKKYSENEVIDLNNFNFKITNSYISKYDYKGNKLLKESNSYVIVKFNITNLGDEKRGITLDNLRLEVNNNIYLPTTTHYSYFIDIANGYYSQEIDPDTSKDYIAVYIVSDEDISSSMIVRYTDKITYKDSEVNINYKRIVISPKLLDKMIDADSVSLNEKLDFSDSLLDKTTLILTTCGIKEKYTYTYNNVDKYIINENGLVLKLSYAFDIAPSISYITDFNNFINKYATIVYTYNNKEYTLSISNITPTTYKENDVFISVDETIKNATNIKLVFNIRNIEYVYIIK